MSIIILIVSIILYSLVRTLVLGLADRHALLTTGKRLKEHQHSFDTSDKWSESDWQLISVMWPLLPVFLLWRFIRKRFQALQEKITMHGLEEEPEEESKVSRGGYR